jgi:hypothetical protein
LKILVKAQPKEIDEVLSLWRKVHNSTRHNGTPVEMNIVGVNAPALLDLQREMKERRKK